MEEPADTSSFLLIDEQEQIVVDDYELFAYHLHCYKDARLKVVSIFGNTGDGKSHTLNHVFFNGREVFRTSPEQRSCTVGVWAAYAPHHRALVIDTEGLLGLSQNENRRIRLLLKTLAISDIVIYRTRAERLHNDMFLFLDDASSAYWKHFSPELETVSQTNGQSISSLGPSVIIFHETQFTEVLPSALESLIDDEISYQEGERMSAEEHVQQRFAELKLSPKAFSAIEYVGTQTITPPTDFIPLKKRLSERLRNNSVRSPRTLDVIYKSLQTLNENFTNDISGNRPPLFPDFYFSCQQSCIACRARCDLSTNHTRHGKQHTSNSKCKYLHKLDNRIMLCKKCSDNGLIQEVSPKAWSENESSWFGIARYAWSGYIIECPSCGIIYQSRQHWYGNAPPEHGSIITENKHIWKEQEEVGGDSSTTGDINRYRQAIDLVNTVGESISQATSSTQQLLADKVAPDYWIPNSDIKCCCVCSCDLTGLTKTKHHCRACGQGVCDRCSTGSMLVPWRGWGDAPVRVCDNCYNSKDKTSSLSSNEDVTVSSRYITENLTSAVGWVGSILEYPKQAVVESARPSYWIPDIEIINCCVCELEFELTGTDKHHCRSCGCGVCDDCSQSRQSVPSRGWDYPVRVCNNCLSSKQ